MRLIPYDINKIYGRKSYKLTANMELIKEFAEGKNDCVKVEGYGHKTAYGCASSLSNTIKRMKMYSVKACVYKGEVYLFKVEAKKNK